MLRPLNAIFACLIAALAIADAAGAQQPLPPPLGTSAADKDKPPKPGDEPITTASLVSGESPWIEWEKMQGQEDRLRAYGPDLLGDSIDPHTGSLSFEHTDVSLPGNSHLEVLDVRKTSITGVSLKFLLHAKHLRSLRTEDSKVDIRAIYALRQALPECEIK